MYWDGSLVGAAPVKRNLRITADCYVGQLVMGDITVNGGSVKPIAVAAAGPDTASQVVGVITGIINYTPVYNSTYQGDTGTYDVTQATQLANDPKGAVLAEVTLLTPGSLLWAPIVKDTIGTACERKACTTTVTNGLTYIVGTIDTTVSYFSTSYCASGANRGVYRTITTGAVATQTHVIAFPYTITTGDYFTIANIVEGRAHIDFDSQFQGIDSSPALTSYYNAWVHELNLEIAGQEYAVFTLDGAHCVLY